MPKESDEDEDSDELPLGPSPITAAEDGAEEAPVAADIAEVQIP